MAGVYKLVYLEFTVLTCARSFNKLSVTIFLIGLSYPSKLPTRFIAVDSDNIHCL